MLVFLNVRCQHLRHFFVSPVVIVKFPHGEFLNVKRVIVVSCCMFVPVKCSMQRLNFDVLLSFKLVIRLGDAHHSSLLYGFFSLLNSFQFFFQVLLVVGLVHLLFLLALADWVVLFLELEFSNFTESLEVQRSFGSFSVFLSDCIFGEVQQLHFDFGLKSFQLAFSDIIVKVFTSADFFVFIIFFLGCNFNVTLDLLLNFIWCAEHEKIKQSFTDSSEEKQEVEQTQELYVVSCCNSMLDASFVTIHQALRGFNASFITTLR